MKRLFISLILISLNAYAMKDSDRKLLEGMLGKPVPEGYAILPLNISELEPGQIVCFGKTQVLAKFCEFKPMNDQMCASIQTDPRAKTHSIVLLNTLRNVKKK